MQVDKQKKLPRAIEACRKFIAGVAYVVPQGGQVGARRSPNPSRVRVEGIRPDAPLGGVTKRSAKEAQRIRGKYRYKPTHKNESKGTQEDTHYGKGRLGYDSTAENLGRVLPFVNRFLVGDICKR